ncbi:hypothetical protein AX16_003980 [Volvariella volvacea WC 439]|nr:hypothetical protein AX16_003980 [Volvariella volvacea WC 439]
MNSTSIVDELAASNNTLVAGLGEIVQVLMSAESRSSPIIVECGQRTMALGRARMASLSGRNAFLYLQSKFGLLDSRKPLHLEAIFTASGENYIEIDMDAWEELVPHIKKLRVYASQ